MKAVSAASRPVEMRSRLCRGASWVASTTHHASSTNASATAWNSIGLRPGAYTAASLAGTLSARSKAMDRCAKSRQTPCRPSRVRTAPSVGRLEPVTYVSFWLTQVITAWSNIDPGQPGELARRGRTEAVGLAVAAGSDVHDLVDLLDRRLVRDPVDRRLVVEHQRVARCGQGVQPAAMGIDDLHRLDRGSVDADREGFALNRRSLGRRDAEDQLAGAGQAEFDVSGNRAQHGRHPFAPLPASAPIPSRAL